MRKWCGLFLSGALAIGLATPSLAEPKDFTATFSLELGSFPPFEATASGSLDATIDGGSGEVTAFTIPVSTFKLKILTPVDPKVDIGQGIFLTGVSVIANNVAGKFSHAGVAGDGKMSVKGQSILNLTAGGSPLVAKIPLTNAIGTTGQVKAKLLGVVPITLDAVKWTLGKATLTTIPLGGGAKADVFATGMFAVNGSTNSFTYVAPTQITIQTDPVSLIASFGFLQIDILDVPEAGNALLLATGAAVLIAMGMRRRSVA